MMSKLISQSTHPSINLSINQKKRMGCLKCLYLCSLLLINLSVNPAKIYLSSSIHKLSISHNLSIIYPSSMNHLSINDQSSMNESFNHLTNQFIYDEYVSRQSINSHSTINDQSIIRKSMSVHDFSIIYLSI